MKIPVSLLLLALLIKPALGLDQQAASSKLESLVAAARKAQSAGDYASAASAYQEAAKLSPGVAELWANLGLMLHETGDFEKAIVSFQTANHLNPSLYVPNLFLGIDFQHSGKSDRAIPFLLKAEHLNATDPQAPLALGRAYLASRKYDAAVKELDRAAALAPNIGTVWFTAGVAHLDKVESDAYELSTKDKDSAFAGALYAQSLLKQARFGEAAHIYETLLNTTPQPPCIRAEMGFAYLRGHDAKSAAAAFQQELALHPECGLATMGEARRSLESGDVANAAATLNQLWNRDQGFVRANISIMLEGLAAKTPEFLNELLEAPATSADLRRAILAVVNPDQANLAPKEETFQAEGPAPARSTSETLYHQGNFRACANQLAPQVARLSLHSMSMLAACSFYTGDNHLTLSAAERMAILQPQSLEALYWSIEANERLAFEALARFQQLEPDSTKNHILLGDMYAHLERFDDAQTEYLHALSMSPESRAAMTGLATAYLSNNNAAAALETADSALARNPEDAELNLIAAEAELSLKDFAAAEPYLDKSLHVKPQLLPHVHALLGRVYAETGRTQEAIRELEMSESSDEDGTISYLLARLYRQTGDAKEANDALERMKEIKTQLRARGMKIVEDPDLSPLESSSTAP